MTCHEVAGKRGLTCHDQAVSIETGKARWLALEGVVNARVVVPGFLLRADNLQDLTPQDVRVLLDELKVEVVLDLRTEVEIGLAGPGPLAGETDVRIEHRSLYPDSGGNTDLAADMIQLWQRHDDLPEKSPVVRAYMSYLRRRPDSVVAAIRTIARAENAVLVHCAAGKDRTGVVVALALDAVGIERETIMADYLASTERIDAILARLISSPIYRAELEGHDPHRHAPVRPTMERFLELVDQRHGGSAAWLLANGLSHSDLEQLRRRLAPRVDAPR